MFGYSKSAITLFLFSFTVLGKKNCVQAFLSLGSAEESSRGFHALLTFVSSLWWCFFFFLLTENECDQKLLKL